MNREILFRGKQFYDGEWIYGSLLEDDIIVTKGATDVDEDYIGFSDEWSSVDSETVGQFTGLTDKNGTNIFEGDILSDGVQKYEVKYLGTSCGFNAIGEGKSGMWSLYHLAHEGNMNRKIEIVGNIYE